MNYHLLFQIDADQSPMGSFKDWHKKEIVREDIQVFEEIHYVYPSVALHLGVHK